MDTQKGKPKNMIFVYLLVVFFAMFIGTGIFLTFNNKSGTTKNQENDTTATIKQEQMVIPTSAPTEGSFNLVLANGATSAKIDDEVQINVVADSNESNISGYDLALSYDPLAFDFVRATSNLSDFKIFSYKKSKDLSLLGTKSIQSQEPSVFSQTKIVSLFFKPVKIGSYNFSLKSKIDIDKTDLVTDKTEVLNPQLNDLVVLVN